MNEAEKQLQEALTTTFLANLAFLSEYDNELYLKVDELSRMIGDGRYKEKYSLEFLTEQGEFDIYDIVNDRYLYNKNPKKINNELIRKAEFDDKDSIANVCVIFLEKNKNSVKLDNFSKFELQNLSQLQELTLNDALDYLNITDLFLKDNKKRLKHVKKFIFLGTLCGRHIPKIANKIDSDMYLVLEKNLEIFRLSLFTVNYTILGVKGVIFSIMDTIQKTEEKIAKFLTINFFDSYLLKFSTTNINIEEYVDTILSICNSLNPLAYDYNRRLYTHVNRTTNYLSENYKTILLNKTKKSFDFFENIPILFIAGGPSLEENIKWIKNNHKKFFIVTVGAVYKILLSNNIHIDIISTVDEQFDILNDRQFDDYSVKNISQNTLIFASFITNKNILNKFNQDNLFLFEMFFPMIKSNIALDGFSVGEITLDMLIHLNAKNIYLLGLDLALNQETGLSHSQDSISGLTKLDLNTIQTRNTFNARKSLIKVKGNHRDFVYTTPLFYSSIKILEKKLFFKNPKINIYNLSQNGALLEGTISKRINEINLESMSNLNLNTNKLHSLLKQNSITDISKVDKEELKNKTILIETIILNEYLNLIKEKTYTNFNDFKNDLTGLIQVLSLNNLSEIKEILMNYLSIFIPYLNYYFNSTKIKNEDKKIKQTKETLIQHIRNIIEDYIICINRIL